MGEVKDIVKGQPKKKIFGKSSEDNLIMRIDSFRKEVSYLIEKKDNDTFNEGESEKAENIRKAACLRASHSLLTSVQVLLEDY